MKLYQVPRESWVRTAQTGELFFFDHVDGMYSFCRNAEGKVVHLAAGTEVEVLDKPPGNP